MGSEGGPAACRRSAEAESLLELEVAASRKANFAMNKAKKKRPNPAFASGFLIGRSFLQRNSNVSHEGPLRGSSTGVPDVLSQLSQM